MHSSPNNYIPQHQFPGTVSDYFCKKGKIAAEKISLNARPIQLNVTDKASIAAASETIRTAYSCLDLLVNNAQYCLQESRAEHLKRC